MIIYFTLCFVSTLKFPPNVVSSAPADPCVMATSEHGAVERLQKIKIDTLTVVFLSFGDSPPSISLRKRKKVQHNISQGIPAAVSFLYARLESQWQAAPVGVTTASAETTSRLGRQERRATILGCPATTSHDSCLFTRVCSDLTTVAAKSGRLLSRVQS